MQVGFVGLGAMGGRMARNLLKAGHRLVVHDPLPTSVAAVAGSAGKACMAVATPADVVKQLASNDGGVIFTMLPDPPTVQRVYCAEQTGMLNHASPNITFVDCSTIGPATAQHVSKVAADMGSVFADAPVGGAVPGAENGTLTFMVGCDQGADALAPAGPAFDAMGSNVVHCGRAGSGQAAKLCNNMVLATTMVAVSEGMLLGQKLGLDPNLLASIFNNASARCWALDTYNPCPGVVASAPSSRGYKEGWPTSGMQKDMSLALEAAREASSATPLSAIALDLYSTSAAAGWQSKDFSSIYQFLKEQSDPSTPTGNS